MATNWSNEGKECYRQKRFYVYTRETGDCQKFQFIGLNSEEPMSIL